MVAQAPPGGGASLPSLALFRSTGGRAGVAPRQSWPASLFADGSTTIPHHRFAQYTYTGGGLLDPTNPYIASHLSASFSVMGGNGMINGPEGQISAVHDMSYGYTFPAGYSSFLEYSPAMYDAGSTDVTVAATMSANCYPAASQYSTPQWGFGVSARVKVVPVLCTPGVNYVGVPVGLYFVATFTHDTHTGYQLAYKKDVNTAAVILGTHSGHWLTFVQLSPAGTPMMFLQGTPTLVMTVIGQGVTCAVDGDTIITATLPDAALSAEQLAGPCSWSSVPALNSYPTVLELSITAARCLVGRATFPVADARMHHGVVSVLLADQPKVVSITDFGQPVIPLGDTLMEVRQVSIGAAQNTTYPDGWTPKFGSAVRGTATAGARAYAGVNVGTGNGWVAAEHAYNPYGLLDAYGVTLRANKITKRWLWASVNDHNSANLWIVNANGSPAILLAHGNIPPVPEPYGSEMMDATNKRYLADPGGVGYPQEPAATTVLAHAHGSTIDVYAPYFAREAADSGADVPPSLCLSFELTGALLAEFGQEQTIFGWGTAAMETTIASVATRLPSMKSWLFSSDVPQDIYRGDPPVIIEPGPAVHVPAPGDSTLTFPPTPGNTPGVGGGWTDPGGNGPYGGITRNPVTGDVTPWVVIKKPGGVDEVITGAPYTPPSGTPTDGLTVTIRKRGDVIEILYGGVIIFTYTLTAANYSGLQISTQYVSFLDSAHMSAPAPAGTVIIRTDWVATAPSYELILPVDGVRYRELPRPWNHVPWEVASSLMIKGGAVSFPVTNNADEIEVADAFYAGGYKHVLSTAEANVLAVAGYSTLLKEITL